MTTISNLGSPDGVEELLFCQDILGPIPSGKCSFPFTCHRLRPFKIEGLHPLKLKAFMGNRPNYGSKVGDAMMCENSRGKAKSGEMAKILKLEEWKLK